MRRLALATVLALGAAAPVVAQSDDVLFGLRAGVVDVDGFEPDAGATIDADLGPSAGGFIDFGLGSLLSAGLYADVHGLTGDFDDRSYMIDAGGTLKLSLGDRGGRAYLRPGIGVGYASVDVGPSADFLTTRGTVEVVVPQAGHMSWLFEAGLYWAPSGSIGDDDGGFGPGFLLRAGVLF